jgi:phospholipase C
MTSNRLFLVLCLSLAAIAACDPQKGDFGLGAIRNMKTPPDNPNLGCGLAIPADPAAAQRSACSFGVGAHASTTLGFDSAAIAAMPIRHVIIAMKENRSFDHLLGALHERGQPNVEAVPATFSNPDTKGTLIYPFAADTTCIPYDPGHQQASVHTCLDDSKMDGFIRNAASTTPSDGTFVMSSYDDNDLPFYYWLAATFAVNDRHFAPLASGTYANRAFYMLGSNVGIVDTGIVFPNPSTPSIMQLMMNAGYTWGAYTDSEPFDGAFDWDSGDPGVYSMQALYDALDAGTLPNLVFVDGAEYLEDDHPVADLQRGEAWLKVIYDHLITSPEWPRTAMIWTYDEAGAFADHVSPPPGACAPDPSNPPFAGLGPRIPLVVISPWAKRNYASHVVEDHTAIIRLVEAIFDLPALSGRDANQTALLDMFDFSCGRDLSVPVAPAAGTGGCAHKASQPD